MQAFAMLVAVIMAFAARGLYVDCKREAKMREQRSRSLL